MQRSHGEEFPSGGDDTVGSYHSTPAEAERIEVVVELDADVVAKIRALGPNWQEKVNAILKMAKV